MLKKIISISIILLCFSGVCFSATFKRVDIKNGVTNLDILDYICDFYNIDLNNFNGDSLTRYNEFINKINDYKMILKVYNYTNDLSRYDLQVYLINKNIIGNITSLASMRDCYIYNTGDFYGWYTFYYSYNVPPYQFLNVAHLPITDKTSYRVFSANNSPISPSTTSYCLMVGTDGLLYQYSVDDSVDISNISTFKFRNSWTGTINVNANGVTESFYKVTQNRSSGKWWKLGDISGYNDYLITAYIGPYVDYDIVDFTQARSDYISSFNIKNSNNLAFVEDKGNNRLSIYVNQYWLLYYQGYKLQLVYRENNSSSSSEININYYILPYGSNDSSGDLISPNLNNDLDLEFIRSIDELNNVNDIDLENNNHFYSFYFSGDNFSGDFLGFHYNDYDSWGFGNLYRWVLDRIYFFATNFTDITINFGFLGEINSSQFIFNVPLLTSFLSLFTNAFLIIFTVFFYYKFLKSLSELDIGSISSFSIDENFKLF